MRRNLQKLQNRGNSLVSTGAWTREYEILALKFVEMAESAEIAELSKEGYLDQ